MTPIQQLMLGVGAKKKVYLDNVFSTDLWKGDGSAHQVVNNIDLSGEGGMVWTKARSAAEIHLLTDTVRSGTNPTIFPNESAAEQTGTDYFSSINNNGFTTGTWAGANGNNTTFAGWTFRKAPGFFDCVQFTGNSTNRTIAHSLGCVPGLIMIKNVSASENWRVYHRATKATHNLQLNDTDAAGASSTPFNNTEPTASVFSVGTDGATNGNGQTIVAYLFAGGESNASEARSVEFDNSGDLLYLGASNDFHFTGDFTIEGWFYSNGHSSYDALCGLGEYNTTGGFEMYYASDGKVLCARDGSSNVQSTTPIGIKQWTHIALVRSGSAVSIYVNGVKEDTETISGDFGSNTNKDFRIGAAYKNDGSTVDYFDGKISNFRIVKGTAVYTSSFKPPTEPLTNISGTVLLCCNNSSTTGKTTGGTITATGDPTASTDSPFDDPAAFTFGESGSESVIKTGSYVGNGSSTGQEINLGWEPQWVMVKRTDSADNWAMYDVMRGITTGGTDNQLRADQSAVEHTTGTTIAVTPTGFKFETSGSEVNANNGEYIYICIRSPDGYVGKPAELGSEVFSMNSGANSGAPLFDSTHVVDYQFVRKITATWNWETGARLIGSKQVYLNTTGAETNTDPNGWKYDYMNGWHTNASGISNYMCWMWKRHAGFDVVAYDGQTESIKDERHQLNAVPEMMWVKARTGQYAGNANWFVYHKGLNGGTNPHTYNLNLNTSDAESSGGTQYWQRPPTSTHFSHGNTGGTGYTGWTYIAMLFASTDVSKVGYYDGSSSSQTITTGFQPRFLMIKGVTVASDWFILDTTRGWASGNDTYIMLNANQSQASDTDFGAPTSTGFTLTSGTTWNSSGNKFIYYAHA
jgi:hypothetical protein